ncbi:unnamed protein product [Diatraea saccharalis]|uniref:Rap1 Myb domain-containing protein n=1 Tax=Diatraea saccharalis TaxID=40085 RepID=A0A9N9RFE7_9NEOP|nr:unnamed protein product [Diatraea saccharalis]
MKEMKTIVEYLVEHRAYGEIKGRKMWIDFSNSQLTNRTWQSLKETFLKRILPDIHNPYYKLTMDQVCSFRQGFDVQSREKNKLEIQKLDGNSNSNAENLKTNEQPSTSKCIDEDKTSGEEIKSSRISARDRASVETVILDNCYETADDVLRDLESPNDSNDKEETAEGKSQSKSLRDLITYSEPLTPMLQEVLHDFATDDESDSGEPKMQIVENEQEPEEQGNVSSHRVPDAVEDILEHNKDQNDKRNKDESDKFVEPKVKSLRLRKRQGIYVPVDDLKASQNTNTTNSKNNKSDSNVTRMEIENGSGASMLSNSNEKGVDKLTKSHAQSTQNCSTSTTDTVLPNNQEALHDKKLENKKNRNEITVNKNNITRDRTASNDIEVDLKLQKANCNETTHNHISDANVDSQKTNCSDVIDISNEIDKNQNKKSDVVNNKQTPEDNTRDIFPPNKLPEKGDKNTSTQSSQANPCLQSMSLYDEQFNMTNHTSDSSEHETNNDQPRQTSNNNKPSSVTENKLASKLNEVVMLKSRSDTDSDSGKVPVKKDTKNIVLSKLKRDNALANIFGFSSGKFSMSKWKLSKWFCIT